MSPMRARVCVFPGLAARRCSSILTAVAVAAGSKYAIERNTEEAVCPSSASAGYCSARACSTGALCSKWERQRLACARYCPAAGFCSTNSLQRPFPCAGAPCCRDLISESSLPDCVRNSKKRLRKSGSSNQCCRRTASQAASSWVSTLPVSHTKIANKNRVMGESAIRVHVQAKIHLGRAPDERLKIVFQLTTLEDPDGVLRELLEFRGLFLAQVKTCQFVIPRAVRKARHR